MTANGIDGDFTIVDTATLNRYFREYYLEHGQGGTHTQQRNLIQLFNFLERERGVATPYADGLNRYAAVKGRPKTLSGEFIDDLLEVTGGGRARDFETARDHAIIRILRSEGIRRMELLSMVMHTMPADVIQNSTFRLVPLKGARAAGEGRLVMLAPSTARALAMYLRARRHHPLADSDWVWLGTRGRGRLLGTGIRKMLIRRAEQAGYAGVTPHQFRHTFSDAWLKSGGSEGDLMRLNGWKSRAMVDRYADDVANQRALRPSAARATLSDLPAPAHSRQGVCRRELIPPVTLFRPLTTVGTTSIGGVRSPRIPRVRCPGGGLPLTVMVRRSGGHATGKNGRYDGPALQCGALP